VPLEYVTTGDVGFAVGERLGEGVSSSGRIDGASLFGSSADGAGTDSEE
jgi:hypothetical protein